MRLFIYALILQVLFYTPIIYGSEVAAKKGSNAQSTLSDQAKKELTELVQALNKAIANNRMKRSIQNIPTLKEEGGSKYIEIKKSHPSCKNIVSKAREVMTMRHSGHAEETMKKVYTMAYKTNKPALNLLLTWIEEAFKETQHDMLDLKVKSIMEFMDEKRLWCDEKYGVKVQRIEAN